MGTRNVLAENDMEYSHLSWELDDHQTAPLLLWIPDSDARTSLKLVPLLTTIGTEPQLSPTVSLSRREAFGP